MLKPVESVLEYCFNYTYIVEELCENRDKPKLNCNGKCYLMKQLKKQNKKSPEKQKSQSIQLENYPIGFIEIVELEEPQTLTEQNQQIFFYFNQYAFLTANIPFQPPKYCFQFS